MRVIAGTCRGMRLSAPRGMTTRPTSDRVKEALFSIISSRMSLGGVHVLDICAGTGSLGIEALSRGAAFATFIEQDQTVQPVLHKNLAAARCLDRSEVIGMDALSALKTLATRGSSYGLVVLDPPYDSALYLAVSEMLTALGLLKPESLLVAECSARCPLPPAIGPLVRIDRRVYGDTALELFTLGEA